MFTVCGLGQLCVDVLVGMRILCVCFHLAFKQCMPCHTVKVLKVKVQCYEGFAVSVGRHT